MKTRCRPRHVEYWKVLARAQATADKEEKSKKWKENSPSGTQKRFGQTFAPNVFHNNN